jgi:hypothetical protein
MKTTSLCTYALSLSLSLSEVEPIERRRLDSRD